MKNLSFLAVLICMATPALAWEGFDADTTNIVEVAPEQLPSRGDKISVRDYENETLLTCIVENVRRNKRTIELVVRCPEDSVHTLVMDGF